MNVFLQFLFDIEQLNQHVRNGWIELYDQQYIDKTIITGLEERLPQMADLLSHISEKATGKQSSVVASLEESQQIKVTKKQLSVEKKKPTQPEPFNLTKPKAKKIPDPIVINKEFNIKKVPKDLNKVNLEKLKKEREEKLQEQK